MGRYVNLGAEMVRLLRSATWGATLLAALGCSARLPVARGVPQLSPDRQGQVAAIRAAEPARAALMRHDRERARRSTVSTSP